MSDFIKLRLTLSGEEDLLREINDRYFIEDRIDYNRVIPMPPALDISVGSNLETGYAALYGDWQSIAKQWMFKEPAADLGFPWPLENREQVIKSLQWFDCADFYLYPAKAYKTNLDQYGHGSSLTWMKEYWGCDCNADKDRLEGIFSDGKLHVRFNAGSYPKLVFKKLSELYPTVSFKIQYVNEYDRPGRSFILQKGREVEKHKLDSEELKRQVHSHPTNGSWSMP